MAVLIVCASPNQRVSFNQFVIVTLARLERTNLSSIDKHAFVLVESGEDSPELPGPQPDPKVLQQLRTERGRVHLHLRTTSRFLHRAREPRDRVAGRSRGAGGGLITLFCLVHVALCAHPLSQPGVWVGI